MSKRSYRRLALVAGAALAVGSIAPAMAAQVGAGGSGSASVDLSGVTGALPSISSLVPTALVGSVTGTALNTVQGAPTMVLGDVSNLMSGALGITDGLTGTGSIASVNVAGNSDTSINVLGSGVAVTGVAGTAAGLAGAATAVPGAIVGTALGAAAPVVNTALGLANTAVGLAQSAPGTVLGTAGGLLNSGLGLTNILGGSPLSGNLGASLVGTF